MRNVRSEQGFTLIELVVVIVILGIMAATAIPKFVDLSSEAGTAAANGVAGSIASGSSVNYASALAGKTQAQGVVQLNHANVCTETGELQKLVTGITLQTTASSDAKTFQVGGTGACNGANAAGTAVTCNITGYKGTAAAATVICTGAVPAGT